MAELKPGVPLLAPDDPALVDLDANATPPANLYRALAHRPELLAAWLAFAGALRSECALARALRELVILRSAALAGARYVWSDHVPMALSAGVRQEQVEALGDWRAATVFARDERAALALADELARGALAGEQTLAELSACFTPGERVELALTAGFYAMVPRVLSSLRVPLPDRELTVPFPSAR
ncbi:MAG TPA: carboxymuconolactone decarboxylase family protein [Solirubrobacteraceae bacterium]|jgi:alkylhydroperoxidase family enzyme|nr:carboxymuconolactone decarboxylase family protein [Solirubrobacteraceae bacterium]